MTFCTNFSVRCTICRSHVLSPLTSNQFELQRSLIRINFLCLDLQNFKSLESGDVHQNFWSSESWALGLQNLQVFKSWRRSSELLSLESSALDQKLNFRSWDCSSELPVSESSTWSLGKLSESSEADVLQSQKQCLQKRFRILSFSRLTSDELFSGSESESV